MKRFRPDIGTEMHFDDIRRSENSKSVWLYMGMIYRAIKQDSHLVAAGKNDIVSLDSVIRGALE